jgi:hypothetical protein
MKVEAVVDAWTADPAGVIAWSRALRDENRALRRASHQIQAESKYRIVVSLDTLAWRGRARRFCGASDSVATHPHGPECAECHGVVGASDTVMYVSASRELLHLACFDRRNAGGSHATGETPTA